MNLFSSPPLLFTASIALRMLLLLWGLYQDATSPLKYTDIDYFVFTDAARYIAHGHTPYARATYRYTPLLAYILLPTTWSPQWLWFHFGKILFASADIVAGWLTLLILRQRGMDAGRAGKFASIWLLNPMVATISTRGSSEGLLGVMTMALLWAVLNRRFTLAGTILGLAVHFKIYPFIYATSIIWYLESPHPTTSKPRTLKSIIVDFINESRLALTLSALSTFSTLNLAMFILHGMPFMQHTYLYHLTRTDHRHNFSPYNTLLYLSSARSASNPSSAGVGLESLTFLPQLLLSAVLIPLVCAKRDLAGTMLAQTWAFVTFNKVCTSQVFLPPIPISPSHPPLTTSQYFLWYLILLPLHLPTSQFLSRPTLGVSALAAWIAAQALWLQQGYQLEFLGRSTFTPGLFLAGLSFFVANIWILGVIIGDIARTARQPPPLPSGDETLTIPEQVERELKARPPAEAAAERAKIAAEQERGRRGGGDRYRNVLEEYMSDLSASGVAGRDQVQGMVLGEVDDEESE